MPSHVTLYLPIHTASLALVKEAHVCVNNLPRVVTLKWKGWRLNSRAHDRKSDAQTTAPSRHLTLFND